MSSAIKFKNWTGKDTVIYWFCSPTTILLAGSASVNKAKSLSPWKSDSCEPRTVLILMFSALIVQALLIIKKDIATGIQEQLTLCICKFHIHEFSWQNLNLQHAGNYLYSIYILLHQRKGDFWVETERQGLFL